MLIKVSVVADAKKEVVQKETSGAYRIQVKEPAADNQANIRVRQLLAQALGLKPTAVKLVTGHRRPQKKFEVSLEIKE